MDMNTSGQAFVDNVQKPQTKLMGSEIYFPKCLAVKRYSFIHICRVSIIPL